MAFKDGKWQNDTTFSNSVINSSSPEQTSRASTKSLDNNAKAVGSSNRRATVEDLKALADDYDNNIDGYTGKAGDWLIALLSGDTDAGFSGEVNFGAKWFDKETYKSWAEGVKTRWETEQESNALDIENAVIQEEMKDALEETGEYWKSKGLDIVTDIMTFNPFGDNAWEDLANSILAAAGQTTDYYMSKEYKDLLLIKLRASNIRDNPLGYRVHTLSGLGDTNILPGGLTKKDNKLRARGQLALSDIMIYPDAITKTMFWDSNNAGSSRQYSDTNNGTLARVQKAYMYDSEDSSATSLSGAYWYGNTNIATPGPQNIYNLWWSDSLSYDEIKHKRESESFINETNKSLVSGVITTKAISGNGPHTLTLRQYIDKLEDLSLTKTNGQAFTKWNISLFNVDKPSASANDHIKWVNEGLAHSAQWKFEDGYAKLQSSTYSKDETSETKDDAYKAGLSALKASSDSYFIGKAGIEIFEYDPSTVVNRVLMQQCFENGYNMFIHIVPLKYGDGDNDLPKNRAAAVENARKQLQIKFAREESHLGIDARQEGLSKDDVAANTPIDATWLLYSTCAQMLAGCRIERPAKILKKLNPDSWNTMVYRADGITVPKLSLKAANVKNFGVDVPVISRSFDQNNIATVNFRIDRELAMLYTLGAASGYSFTTDDVATFKMSFTDLLSTSFYKRYAMFISTGHFGSADIARELMQANQIDQERIINSESYALNQSMQRRDKTIKWNPKPHEHIIEHYHLFHMFNDVKLLGFSSNISLENIAQGKAVSLPVNMSFKDIDTLTESWDEAL